MAASTSAPSITSIKTSDVSASTFLGNSTLPAAAIRVATPARTSATACNYRYARNGFYISPNAIHPLASDSERVEDGLFICASI